MNKSLKWVLTALAVAIVLAVGSTYGASWYYTSQHGSGCASCHEMAAYVGAVHGSGHRNVNCMQCHEAGLATKLRHIHVHLFGTPPENLRLRDVDVLAMTPNCQSCHQHEYASWHAGPHAATYRQIFADPHQNKKQHLMEDCLRCHGMHFGGSVRDLVQPQNNTGPWKIVREGFADQPAIPCLACHQVHSNGQPQQRPDAHYSMSGPDPQSWLAFYDRREQMHFAAASLALPALFDGPRPVRTSPDPRQGLCYQCHAPRRLETGTAASANHWGPQVASGDDRTPIGVHEGISCLACHLGHNQNARASCKTCHPKMSNCGLDVETMDTTYAHAQSLHNIHWVKCEDCHQHGIPKPKTKPLRAGE